MMAGDMVVALAATTTRRRGVFGHNAAPTPGGYRLRRVPAREHVPGEVVRLGAVELPQPRRTFAVLGGGDAASSGLSHGVNERNVAVGCTPLRTRLTPDANGLTGGDLVRLALERAGSAIQAVEVLTELVSRHGQAGDPCGHAFVVVDPSEACVVEAAGRHWVLSSVGGVRSVCGETMLGRNWDRISRGTADGAFDDIEHDGGKFDFSRALGLPGLERAANLRRWGSATLLLETKCGRLEPSDLRNLLDRLAGESFAAGSPTAATFLVRLGRTPADMPTVSVAFGDAGGRLHLPVFVGADLPEALETGRVGTPSDETPQELFDDLGGEAEAEAEALWRLNDRAAYESLAGSFMQHCAERLADAAAAEEAAGAGAERQIYFGDF